jgi:hypothetical protein
VGRAALRAFVEAGDIEGRHLTEKRDKHSALDNLIDLSKKEGPETLSFLMNKGLIQEADAARVKRAIAGEHSPLMDAMEAVGNRVKQLLSPAGENERVEEVSPLKKGTVDVTRLSRPRERSVLAG